MKAQNMLHTARCANPESGKPPLHFYFPLPRYALVSHHTNTKQHHFRINRRLISRIKTSNVPVFVERVRRKSGVKTSNDSEVCLPNPVSDLHVCVCVELN